MIRALLFMFLALILVHLPAFDGAGNEKAKPGPIEEQFLALRKEYQAALKGVEDDDKKRKVAKSLRRASSLSA